jgi:16S rRNA (guanine966-N2)-methyltransferase
MRVGGGSARGKRLTARGSGQIRPTSSMVADALFNSLGPRVQGARVLDLFAGTGRLGIEALSRGAEHAVFVERDARNAGVIRTNLAAAGVAARGGVRRGDALAAVATLAAEGRRYDLIVIDPPYGRELQREALRRISAADLLAPGGLAVAEGHWRDDPGDIDGLARVRSSRYGETALWVYARAAKEEEDV